MRPHRTTRKLNAAYMALRKMGMRPSQARYFMVALRQMGFILVQERQLTTAKQINQQIKIIIKLMKANRRRK